MAGKSRSPRGQRGKGTRARRHARASTPAAIRKAPVERYDIDLLIKHPDISPDVITKALGLTPQYFWRRGEPRRTPDGADLGRIQKETMWRQTTQKKGRAFFVGLRALLSRLQPKRDFLAQLVSGGGSMTLIVNLPGDVNMGDILEPRTLRLMSKPGLELGVEIFPNMR